MGCLNNEMNEILEMINYTWYCICFDVVVWLVGTCVLQILVGWMYVTRLLCRHLAFLLYLSCRHIKAQC